MKDIEIIGSADGPTAVYVAETTQEETGNSDINSVLNSRTMSENLDSGVKIMGLGMVAVFGVLTLLYVVIKIMGFFARGKGNKDEKN